MQEYNPEIFKYMMLSAHYRSILEFSPSQFDQVIAGLARIYSALALAERAAQAPADAEVPADFAKSIADAQKGVEASLDDDFNTPEAFARLFDVVRHFNAAVRTPGPVTPKKAAIAKEFLRWTGWLGGLMSLFAEPPQEFLRGLDDRLLRQKNLDRAKVDELVKERAAARTSKNFKKADELRAELQNLGIVVQDTAQGSEWEVAK
jgi:cysteinyl-tRNA synthetase